MFSNDTSTYFSSPDNKMMKTKTCTSGFHWLLDVFLFILVFTLVTFAEFGIINFSPIGFYCKDPALDHKFTPSTISPQLIGFMTLIAPLMLIFFAELIHSNSTPVRYNNIYPVYSWSNFEELMKTTLFWFREFLIGLGLVFLAVEAIKLLLGNPRPHFFDTCKPDKNVDCLPGTFITNFTCTNKLSTFRFYDVTKSFPSGHTGISMYSAIYLSVYLHHRNLFNQRWLIIVIQIFFFFWAAICSMSRITDHRHHWWDVLGGASLGFIIGIITVKYIVNSFEPESEIIGRSGYEREISEDDTLNEIVTYKMKNDNLLKDDDDPI